MTLRPLIAALLGVATALAAAAEVPAGATGHLSSTLTPRERGSAQWFFATAPAEAIPLLSENTRLDMLDYFNSGMDRPSRNSLGGEAVVTGSTQRTVNYRLGDDVEYQLGVFTTAKGDTLVALAETLHIPMADTHVRWFDSRWRPVKPPVAEPALSDWLTRTGRKHRLQVEEQLPFVTAAASLHPEAGRVDYTLSIADYFLEGQRPDALQYLHPRLEYSVAKGRPL